MLREASLAHRKIGDVQAQRSTAHAKLAAPAISPALTALSPCTMIDFGRTLRAHQLLHDNPYTVQYNVARWWSLARRSAGRAAGGCSGPSSLCQRSVRRGA